MLQVFKKRSVVHIIGYLLGILGCVLNLTVCIRKFYLNMEMIIALSCLLISTIFVLFAIILNRPSLMCLAVFPTLPIMSLPIIVLIIANCMYIAASLCMTTEHIPKKGKQKNKRLEHFRKNGY
ncbi:MULTISPECIES: hypothetical protein [unclassified Bacillus (in: firmicutes)]|uniref:hypothetical protein n=1 Tax=unclassified Bacillus (in: firmicutes) TaxID=185979 RepID=UPI0008E8D23E|nr:MULTISPECIES: hypothetical protein [unclassified Bacillus (in: firmicutes)]SFJ77984.1 hypothetical protein SAMN04488574_12721 [Bacillus sp. 71mf]SFS98777.1 hypothetical protein SAMN04488145_106134 [Bacillus sp. 103mf]